MPDPAANPASPNGVPPTPDTPSPNGRGLSGVARQRRAQVVEAAVEVITTQGLHKLSLAKIEQKVGMSRGHLTYYFPTKEAILLAVFDRMLRRMIEQKMQGDGPKPGTGAAWDCVRRMFADELAPGRGDDAEARQFFGLVCTFMAQIHHRDDYRRKLAATNAEWRGMIAADLADSVPAPPVPPAVAASVVMALVQGLGGQLAVDPAAFDRDAMAAAVTRLLAPLFGADPHPSDTVRPKGEEQ